jgi:vacuolar-type H+-ATPase subunit I/STV1
MSKTIDRVRQLREELNEEIAAVDRRISQCRERKVLLEKLGLIPADEALARFERDLDDMARKGRAILERMAAGYCKAAGPVSSYSQLSWLLGIHDLPNGHPNDPAPVFVHLARDQILAEVTEIIGQRCRDEEHRQVPAEDERRAELRTLEEELEQLQKERDELQDELSRSFNFEPSEPTRRKEEREERNRAVDILNSNSNLYDDK